MLKWYEKEVFMLFLEKWDFGMIDQVIHDFAESKEANDIAKWVLEEGSFDNHWW